MPKFRKKPVVVDAVQFLPGEHVEGVFGDEDGHYIITLEGMLRVSSGDYIITGVEGEKYPCKPHIFEKTYEPAEIELDGEMIPVEDKRFK